MSSLLTFFHKKKLKCPAEKPHWPPAEKLNETPVHVWSLYQIWARWIPKSTFFVHNLYLRLITSLTNTSLLSDGQKVCTTLPFFNAHDVKRSLNLIHTENAVPLSFCVIGIFWSCDVFTCYNEHFLNIKYDAHTKEKGITLHLYPSPHIIPPTKVAFVESLDCSMSWQNVIVAFMHALTKTCYQVKKMASLLHLCLHVLSIYSGILL